MLSELACHGEDVFQVGTAVLIGRGAYSGEHHLDIVEDLGEVGGELQASYFRITLDEFFESWLVDGHDAVL